ncbi:MAG TPA: hypothetical protein VJC17_03380 [Candidatus Dojkabacteria bacterium]|nr:hypothetical protein [Candidatus Dojkabacteria bacterium]
MNYNEFFIGREPLIATRSYWMSSVLIKGVGRLLSLEEIALNTGEGYMLMRQKSYYEALALASKPLKNFDEFLTGEVFDRVLQFSPSLASVKLVLSRVLKPNLKEGFVIISPSSSFGYCLTTKPENNWRNSIGAYKHLALIDFLLNKSQQGSNAFVDDIALYLTIEMSQKFHRLSQVFSDFKSNPEDVVVGPHKVRGLISIVRRKLAEINAPYRIPYSKSYFGYYIEPVKN